MSTGPADAIRSFNERAVAENWLVRCDDADNLVQPELATLRDLWRSKAANAGIPLRRDFDMRTLKTLVRHVSVIERVPGLRQTRFKFRLVGSEIAHVFGDSTGRFLDEVIAPRFVPSWRAAYALVLGLDDAIRLQSWYQIPQADFLTSESLCAPVRGARGTVDTVLSATYFAPRLSAKNPFAHD
jgi:hypothetical protein